MRLLSELLGRAALPADHLQRCSLAISTVDGYQGREADAVVFSAVRCNPEGRVGFLADERRLNVAITRPRRGLVVVGHQATLAHDPNWAAWMAWVAAQRKQRAAPGAAGGAADGPGAAAGGAAGQVAGLAAAPVDPTTASTEQQAAATRRL